MHLALELAFLPFLLLVGYLLDLGKALFPLALGYLLGSLFLSPDLDLAQSRAARRWGILRFIWRPYALLFPHRGLSHHPVFGPLSRFLYLGLVLSPLGLALGFPWPEFPLSWLLPLLVGLWLPQLLHILADRLRVVRGRG